MRKHGLIFLMTMLVTASVAFPSAAEDNDYSNFTDFSNCVEYAAVTSLEDEMLNRVKEVYKATYDEFPTDFPKNIDFSEISKVYVDTNIENLNTSDKTEINTVLNQSNYVWVIPITVNDKNFQVTVARGLPLNESRATSLTETEKAEVSEKAGRWKITEIAETTLEPYADILENKLMDTSYNSVVLIGGIPGLRMPFALGFENDEAAAWISVGYDSPILDQISAAHAAETEAFDYNTVLEKVRQAEESPDQISGGSLGNEKLTGIRIFAAAGSVVLICITLLLYLKWKL